MRVLIACEESGQSRRAFRARGIDAISCDILPARDGSPHHVQADARDVASSPGWDMLIFHWPCTYVANSGAKHLYRGKSRAGGIDPERWDRMVASVRAFRFLWTLPIPRVCGEWPIIHCHAATLLGIPATQIVQPWQFGHRTMKATTLRLRGLPKLRPTSIVGPPPRDPEERKAWAVVHRMPPGPNRQRDRSETPAGLAAAFADQWGRLPAA